MKHRINSPVTLNIKFITIQALLQSPTKWNIPFVSVRHSVKFINSSTALLSLPARLNQQHQRHCLLPGYKVLTQHFVFRKPHSSSEKRLWRKYCQKTSSRRKHKIKLACMTKISLEQPSIWITKTHLEENFTFKAW